MKKLFTIFTIMTIVAVGILFTSCKEKGYCYCYSSSPYVDYAQMESQAAGMKTEADYTIVAYVNSIDTKSSNDTLSMAKVYPNPVRNTLTIENVADANISIYSITGQLVKTIPAPYSSIQVDMSAMAAGLYIVKMENGKQTRIEIIQVVK